MKKCTIIIGTAGSGKSVLANSLAKKFNNVSRFTRHVKGLSKLNPSTQLLLVDEITDRYELARCANIGLQGCFVRTRTGSNSISRIQPHVILISQTLQYKDVITWSGLADVEIIDKTPVKIKP